MIAQHEFCFRALKEKEKKNRMKGAKEGRRVKPFSRRNSTEVSKQEKAKPTTRMALRASKEAAQSDTASIARLGSLHLFHTPLTLSISS